MSTDRKTPKADIRKNYRVLLEFGLIVVLALLIVAMKLEWKNTTMKMDVTQEQEVVKMKEVVRTQQKKQPPPPPRPTVPVEVPNEKVLTEQNINLDSDFDLNQKLTPPEAPKDTGGGKEEKIFVAVQNMPKLQMSRKELQSKVDYPRSCRMANIEGTVVVQFVVSTTGALSDFNIVKGIGGGCDEAAVEAIKKYAKFSVGRQRGKPVPVRMSFPIVFRLQ